MVDITVQDLFDAANTGTWIDPRVSSYQLTDVLPESLKGSLPSIEELELELHDLQEDEESPEPRG